jgi:hypothetical protein
VAGRRDYAAEYARRIERAFARGLSRSQGRGHPRSGERTASGREMPAYDRRLEEGLKSVRSGRSTDKASKSAHVAPERLRAYLRQTGVVEKQRGRYRVIEDNRMRDVQIYSEGQFEVVRVPGYEEAAKAGRYISAVGEFVRSNDPGELAPYVGDGITDVRGRFHPFETRPNVLYRLTAVRGDTFEQVYRIVV